jgi:bifunctional non-homologous end joining protein LigD
MPLSGATRLKALPKRNAEFIEPMECAPVTKLLDGPGWVYEIELDGYRAVAIKYGDCIDLFSLRRRPGLG